MEGEGSRSILLGCCGFGSEWDVVDLVVSMYNNI